MAVGNYQWTSVSAIEGIRLSGVKAGIKYKDRLDLALIEICEGASVSGVFTRNAFCAEPIKICREHIADATPRYLVINSGNANACTGDEGYKAAQRSCETAASLGQVKLNRVLPFSTGVIGSVLPADKIVNALPAAFSELKPDGWLAAARAIMTTDTRPKGFTRTLYIDGVDVTFSGIAKGAGMIKPNMGTMLGYVATDANIAQDLLDEMTQIAVNKSFNRITVDGDTSTNDALIVMATAKAKHVQINSLTCGDGERLLSTLIDLCQSLAQEMVRDAEGASKCVQVDVHGGASAQESLDVAYAICHSPLIKTAMFASDPNWGRIVAAIGYADIEALDASKVKVWLDEVLVVEDGGCAATYTEAQGQSVFDKEEFGIRVDLGRGSASETLWTSDLSHEYIKINADYRS